MRVGINGFGRIGKSLFLQLLLGNYGMEIVALNVASTPFSMIETYLKYDSCHTYDTDFTIQMYEREKEYHMLVTYKGRTHRVALFGTKDASSISWSTHCTDFLFDATGAYLTAEKLRTSHQVPRVLITSPPKDESIPTFVYGVNHEEYNPETPFISNASCTTNCIAPILAFLERSYGVAHASFTTIHASTASQNILDSPTPQGKSARSNRSIYNNLIPATTGASSAIRAVIPSLDGKVHGMAVRVPTSNVSMVDLVVEIQTQTSKTRLLQDLQEYIQNHRLEEVIRLERSELVSTDFMTSTYATIVDVPSLMEMSTEGTSRFKIILWYDNEWGYTTQCIRMARELMRHASLRRILPKDPIIIKPNTSHPATFPHLPKDLSLRGRRVILRVDWNVPMHKSTKQILDDFRMRATLPTLHRILQDEPTSLTIVSHLGRPKGAFDENHSMQHLLQHTNSLLSSITSIPLTFLPKGIHPESTTHIIQTSSTSTQIYLLENVRFHREETDYEKPDFVKKDSLIYQEWQKMGDIFINSAFGCSHRMHLSMCAFEGEKYIDDLMKSEMEKLDAILDDSPSKGVAATLRTFGQRPRRGLGAHRPEVDLASKVVPSHLPKKKLVILGGAKIDDKLPLCEALASKVDTIYLGGGTVQSIHENPVHALFVENLKTSPFSSTARICTMVDGAGATSLSDPVIQRGPLPTLFANGCKIFDAWEESLDELKVLIDAHDLIFWNGTLGVTENPSYQIGSLRLFNYLLRKEKETIVGGGDTVSYVNSLLAGRPCPPFLHLSTGGGASLDYLVNGGFEVE